MMDDDNMDPARGRLSAIQASQGSPLGFSIRRKLRLGAARLGILSAGAEDIESAQAPAPTDRAQTLVTGTEDIPGQGEPGPAPADTPAAPAPPVAMAESAVPITPDRTVTRPATPATTKPPAAATSPTDKSRPEHSPYADALARGNPVDDWGVELPERKKGTFLLPLRTILEIRAFANLTKQTQYAVVDQAVSEFIANAVDEMNEHQQQRMSELVKRHAYKARVAAEKRARGRSARGKKLDLAARWEPPEDGRMAHFARRVRSGQTNDSSDESDGSASQDRSQPEQ